MYLHIGGAVVVPYENILGIFDLDNTTWSKITRDLLTRAQKEGRVADEGVEGLPKSFLLCKDRSGRDTVYLSQFSAGTLARRMEGTGL